MRQRAKRRHLMESRARRAPWGGERGEASGAPLEVDSTGAEPCGLRVRGVMPGPGLGNWEKKGQPAEGRHGGQLQTLKILGACRTCEWWVANCLCGITLTEAWVPRSLVTLTLGVSVRVFLDELCP